jgi:deazaflavin-dependent oxidoreductase (nitroreductase family)
MVRLNMAALRAGLSVGSQYLLTVPGRKTGEPRQTPISLATVDGKRFIVAAFADANWVANVRGARAGTLSRGKHDEPVALIELDVAERPPILRAFLGQVRGGRRFFGSDDPDEVAARAASYPVFRVDPMDGEN